MSKHRKPTHRAKRLATITAALAITAGTFATFPASAATTNFTLASTDNFDNLNGWTVYDDRPHCTTAGGILTIHGNSDGSTCGMAENHNQTYGKFEVRAKFPTPASHQFDTTFIQWPQDDAIWQSAEMDYIEKTDPTSKSTAAFIHTGVNSQREFHKSLDMTQWHTYGLEWTPGKLVGTVDGVPWFTVTGSEVDNHPHHQTLQMDLNREAGAIVPTNVQVDWFKRYDYTPGVPVTDPPTTTPPVTDPPTTTPPTDPTYVTHGAIDALWRNGNQDRLGQPTSGELTAPTGPGQTHVLVQHFEHGDVYWSAQNGAHYIKGAILARFNANGGAARYGLPSTNETAIPGGYKNGLSNGATIYWSPSTGAHVIQGSIQWLWNSRGATASDLGFPRSEEVTTSYGAYVNFEYGAITWNRSTGRLTVLTWKA